MKNAPDRTAIESAPSKGDSTTPAKSSGTDNPRHFRAIHALLTRPMPREHLDRHVGCSNSMTQTLLSDELPRSKPCKRRGN